MYGQREIAYIGEDIGKRKKSFWEIVILRFITLAIATLIYYFTIIRTAGEYKIYYEILLFYLLASAFDISWFLQGLEEFKKTVMRNLIVRTTSVMLIFVLVKQPNDLSKYQGNINIQGTKCCRFAPLFLRHWPLNQLRPFAENTEQTALKQDTRLRPAHELINGCLH